MLNRITLAGRISRNLDLKYTSSNIPVLSFNIAVDRDISAKNGERETDFIDCVAWRSTAEFVSKYFSKGDMIIVNGRLQSRKWQDKDGNNRTAWEVQCDNCYFAGSKNAANREASENTFTEIDDSDGDLPF